MDDQFQGHEDRIQSLEQGITNNSVVLAEHGVVLAHIQKSIDNSRDGIESKIESGMASINSELQKATKAITGHEDRIKKIEQSEQERNLEAERRQKRYRIAGNVALWIAMGAGGIGLKALTEWALLSAGVHI